MIKISISYVKIFEINKLVDRKRDQPQTTENYENHAIESIAHFSFLAIKYFFEFVNNFSFSGFVFFDDILHFFGLLLQGLCLGLFYFSGL